MSLHFLFSEVSSWRPGSLSAYQVIQKGFDGWVLPQQTLLTWFCTYWNQKEFISNCPTRLGEDIVHASKGVSHVWSMSNKFSNFFFAVIIYCSRRRWFPDPCFFHFICSYTHFSTFIWTKPSLYESSRQIRSYIKVEAAVFISSPAKRNSAPTLCHQYI